MKSRISIPFKADDEPVVMFPVLLITHDHNVVVLATGHNKESRDHYSGFVVWSQRDIDTIGAQSLRTWSKSYLKEFKGQVTLENS